MGGTNNWIIIGTKLDSKQLDKDLNNQKKKLEKYEKEAEKLTKSKEKAEENMASYQAEMKSLEEEIKLSSKLKMSAEQRLHTNDIHQRQIEEINNRYSKQIKAYETANTKLKENAVQQGLINNEITQINSKLKTAHTYDAINNSITKVKNGLTGVLKKVAKWSLAIIGVRSVYLGIRSAMSTLSQYDETIGNRVDYLKWVLANTLKPVIEWIIKALYSIVGLVGKIVSFITGKNIFEHSGIADYEKALKNSNKNAKDLKKTLTGFDEMNVLNEDGSTGVAGKLTGIDTDLSGTAGDFNGITNAVLNASNAFQDYRQSVHDALDNKELFDEEYGNWSYFMQGLVLQSAGILDFLNGLGEFIGGLLGFIVGIFTGDSELIMDSLKMMLSGIIDMIGGIFEFITGIIKLLIGIIIGLVLDFWDGVKEILGAIGGWVYDNVIKPVGDFFAGMWNGFVEGAKDAWEGVKKVFGAVAGFFKDIFTKAWEGVKAVFSTGGKIFTGIKDGILDAFKRIVNVIIDGINKIVKIPFDGINSALGNLRGVDLWGWKPFEWIPQINVPQIPKLAKGGILNNPGKGVYTGGAIAGEAGREFYMPLQDEQMLGLVGEAIGKHINLSPIIPVYVGNRLVAREIRKINNEELFASNG